MESNKKLKIDELIQTTQKVLRSQREKDSKTRTLFESIEEKDEDIEALVKLTDIDVLADPAKSYDLFYKGIQGFLLKIVPASEIRKVILELKTILLTGKEKENITYGKRGADSRQSLTTNMESVIDIITEWAETPEDYLRLATLLLEKNKELNHIPESRTLGDYLKK